MYCKRFLKSNIYQICEMLFKSGTTSTKQISLVVSDMLLVIMCDILSTETPLDIPIACRIAIVPGSGIQVI